MRYLSYQRNVLIEKRAIKKQTRKSAEQFSRFLAIKRERSRGDVSVVSLR